MQKLKLKFLFLAAIVFVFGGSVSFAQQTVSPEKQALIKEFQEVTNVRKNANEMIDAMLAFQESQSAQMLSSFVEQDKNLTPAQKQERRQMTAEATERVSKNVREFLVRLNIGQTIEEIGLPIIDKNYTESELRDIIAFYRTPTGQKTITIAPKMMMEAMMAFSEKFVPKFQEFIKETTEAELAQMKQKLQNGSGRKAVRKS